MNDAMAHPALQETEFDRQLDRLLEKIRSSDRQDQSVLDISRDICTMFNAERLTVYQISVDKKSLISKVKTGLNSFKELKLPISEQSVAGHVATYKQKINIRDVYDASELAAISPQLRFLQEVDKRTGYRTRQLLTVPILERGGELIGVIQLLNNKAGVPFSAQIENAAVEVAEAFDTLLGQQIQATTTVKSRYDHLLTAGIISPAEFDLASRTARRRGLNLEAVLFDEFQVAAADMGKSLALFFGVPYLPFRSDRIKPAELLRNLKREFLQSSHWIPVEETLNGLIILTTDPERIQSSRVVQAIFPKQKLIYAVSSQHEFDQTLDQFFGGSGASASSGGFAVEETSMDDLLSSLGNDEDEEAGVSQADANAAADNELVKLVNKIIMDAYRMGASDIHIEPQPGKGKTLVRVRRDGALLNYIEVPSTYRNALVTRLKIMCDLDISEKRRPQDGKIKFKKYGPADIELRVATIPSQGGVEDIVMRILASGEPLPLDKMAFSARNSELIKATVAKPYGLFFVCGPTGSGKTTTLHAILKHINTPETKIWTAEDPVEITQKGLRQVQINKKAGLDFATIMRAFLRADPDVIMVGEMRDKETVSIGIEASLTGHLVFATLHTNSAPESIIRLLDMGMDPFNFADALLGILAQRLARRLCSDCKKPHVATDEEIQAMLHEYTEELKFTPSWQQAPEAAMQVLQAEWVKLYGNEKGELVIHEPVGCDKCSGTGYRGRVALHELLLGSDRVKKAVQEHARVAELLGIAIEEGMHTLKQDGMEKVLQGVTDMRQVRSVCIK